MRLIIVRALSLAAALGTATPVAMGAMTDPMFVGPDLALAVGLVLGGLMPARLARPGLSLTHAFALGVFSVALAGQVTAGRINPMLILVIATCLASLTLLASLRRPATALS